MTACATGEVFTVNRLLTVDSSSASRLRVPSAPTTVWSATRKPTRAPGKQDLANEPR